MTQKTKLDWIDNLAFTMETDGFETILDASVENGGDNRGSRPKPLLLNALGGCSGMDTVSILKKMHIDNYKLQIQMEGDVTDEYPKPYHTIRMKFVFTGDKLPPEKVIHAVELSITRYCAVYDMLKKSANIFTKIIINEQEVWNAQSN